MTDELNPFDKMGPEVGSGAAPIAGSSQDSGNPFDTMGPDVEAASTVKGSFLRSFERGIAPAIGSLPAMGVGAEIGGATGAAVGSAVPVVGTAIGGAVGGLVGGLAGGIGGATAVDHAQEWALSKLPDSWKEAIGQDDRQRQLDENQHPVASFLGGIAPYALTMRPGGFATTALPENATALQRIMANPATSRVFGGAVMGGIEAGNEKLSSGDIDWRKVAISTGFGLVFNQPTRLGETLMGIGAAPVRAVLAPHPDTVTPISTVEPVSTPNEPTVAQANDLKVMGPGVTEDVYMGSVDRSPSSADTAQQMARSEQESLGPTPEPDLHAVARRIEPDLFARYDALSEQREGFSNWIAEYNSPPPEEFQAAQQRITDLQGELDAHIQAQNGYTGGPEARRLRAQVRDAQSDLQALQDRQTAFAEGRAQETPDLQMARKHLMDVDFQMRDMAADISAAYRRAAEFSDYGIEPESSSEPEVQAPAASQAQASAAPISEGGRPIEEQLAYIASDIAQKLKAAGRPADEAEAAGQLLAARYQTRADRFGGALGTPEALYKAEGPEVKAGKGRPSKAKQEAEMAQRMQGKISIKEDAKPVITLMKDADASTFIHETGHQWLEELMKDDRHPLAPDLLKTDAKTVREWLGMEEGAEIKTRQHEKFARGFEQYMREGVAPSPKLAAIFAKFRNWLIQIYQSLSGLGKPISEDVRNVLDRMISMEPRRTVFAPEREMPSTLADLHEADARGVEPAEADAATDRINSEKNQYIQDQPSEVLNELETAYGTTTAEPAGKTGEGAGGFGQVDQGSGGANVESGRRPRGEEHGALISGRGEIGQEGAGVSGRGGATEARAGGSTVPGSEQRSLPGAENEHPLAPLPTGRLATPESRFVDKAGNIRLDNIDGAESLKQAMREVADANGGFMDQRQKISDGQVLDLAHKLLGEDPDFSQSRKISATVLSSNVKAAEKLVADAAREVARLRDAVNGGGTDADVLSFAAAVERLKAIQGYYSGAEAEIARAFRALRKTQEFWSTDTEKVSEFAKNVDANQIAKDATSRDLFQLRQMAEIMGRLDTPEQIAKATRDASKRSFGRMIFEYFMNNLISGPISHATYAVGNLLNSLDSALVVTPVASLLGKAYQMAGSEGERVMLGEVLARVTGGAKGLPSALEASLAALRTGVGTSLPGEGTHQRFFEGDIPRYIGHELQNVDATWQDVRRETYSLIQGIYDGITTRSVAGNGLGLTYSPTGQIPDITVAGRDVLPIGTLARLPSRGVGAFDSFFRAMNYSVEKNAAAYRAASQEGLQGIDFNRRVAEIRQNPNEQIMERARAEASNLTMMGEVGPIMKKLTQLLNVTPNLPILGETPIFKFIIPFAKVAANVINESAVKRTPVGWLSGELRADLLGRNGGAAMQMAQARMITGTLYSLAIMGLAAEGKITGGGPSDPREAAMWRMAGNQPYSIKIGNTWYSYKRLDPFGFLFGVAADLHEVAHDIGEGHSDEAAHLITHAFAQNLIDESFMRGASDAVRALTDDKRYGQAWLQNMASGFVPYATGMAQWARTVDPYSRRARGFVDTLKSKIPYVSQSLYPSRDIWGEPLQRTQGLGGVTNIYETPVTNDPVNKELYRLNVFPSRVEDSIRNVKLDGQQYDDFSRIAGRMSKMRLNTIVRSPDWNMWPDQTKRDVVDETIRQSREAARGLMMMKYPTIVQQATQAKLAKVRGP